MKKYAYMVLVVILFVLPTACVQQSAQIQSEPAVSQESSPTGEAAGQPAVVVEFSDKILEAAVRKAMNKPQGSITVDEAVQVISLNVGNGSFENMSDINRIKDISALRYFTGLKELDISFNEINDLTPLAGLTNLETLVFNGTWVEDITPLKDLVNLKCLVFCWMRGDSGTPSGIEDLDVLSDLKNLEMIDAKNAGIKDASGLADLPKLWEVQLNDNLITDVSPFADMKALKTLLLAGNPVTDFSTLKEVYGQLEGKDFEIK